MSRMIKVGETVKDSPVGAGVFTDITEAGYPQVNHIAVTWMIMEDGEVYNPTNRPMLPPPLDLSD
jgi:hypothetical protein